MTSPIERNRDEILKPLTNEDLADLFSYPFDSHNKKNNCIEIYFPI